MNLFLVCSQVKGIQQNKEMTLASNRLLAEQNLKLQPMLDHQKNELTRRYRSLQELFEAYQLRNSTLGKILRLKQLPLSLCLSVYCMSLAITQLDFYLHVVLVFHCILYCG